MSNLFEHCRTGVSSASQRYEKPEAMQINLLFAEAKYSRCSQSAISLCQSAAGGGCAGRRRRSDAALCMGGCGLPLFGCGRRANLSKLYFSRPPACGNALLPQKKSILTSGSIPHLRLGVSCEERIYHLLSPKGGAKSVRRAKKSGNGRRLAPKTLRGQARARVFDGASAARSSSRFFAMRNDCALRATMILIPFTRF